MESLWDKHGPTKHFKDYVRYRNNIYSFLIVARSLSLPPQYLVRLSDHDISEISFGAFLVFILVGSEKEGARRSYRMWIYTMNSICDDALTRFDTDSSCISRFDILFKILYDIVAILSDEPWCMSQSMRRSYFFPLTSNSTGHFCCRKSKLTSPFLRSQH